MTRNNLKYNKKVKCDGPTDRRTDGPTDRQSGLSSRVHATKEKRKERKEKEKKKCFGKCEQMEDSERA